MLACNFFLLYPNLHNHSKFHMMVQNCHILIFKFFLHSSKLFSSIPSWLSLFNSIIGYKPIFIVENMNQIPQISYSMISKFPQIQPPIFHYKFGSSSSFTFFQLDLSLLSLNLSTITPWNQYKTYKIVSNFYKSNNMLIRYWCETYANYCPKHTLFFSSNQPM